MQVGRLNEKEDRQGDGRDQRERIGADVSGDGRAVRRVGRNAAPARSPNGGEFPATDTIVAVSSAAGVGAIGIVRLSGPRAVEYAGRVFRAAKSPDRALPSHRLTYGHAVAPDTGVVLDEVLVVAMHGPATYTREDVVEVHCHGGVAAQRAVLRAFVGLGARPAEAGEFTRRAFLHGRIDLTQAESVAAIVGARSASALRAAVHQLEGGLAEQLRSVRAQLRRGPGADRGVPRLLRRGCRRLDRAALEDELADAQARLERLLVTAFLGRALERRACAPPSSGGRTWARVRC